MILKSITTNDISELQKIYVKAYSSVFSNHWIEDGMEQYLHKEAGYIGLKSDIEGVDHLFYFIQHNGANVGFIKLNNFIKDHITSKSNHDSELEKIYMLPEYSGKGIGKQAMKELIGLIRNLGKKQFFLSVVESNDDAIGFYEKLGFEFHSKTRIDEPGFKEELRGMDRMVLKLNRI
ncbi:Acetyltransferase (GNAT) family protein [Tenacibaculum sp. MAR_2009_124]|uniref:GNAT family N-acetyltransferase n=1 Tax=Tenacibaculum sp. MAR_2009_124 TaxID=1250059 RepID=UPI00089D22A2|nr:GNAT family N-acetyltransferase [Tenacibaculum sp. MAR_2009_124]SEB45233.1 Acetyltransferase (GNAT) family protein [Tenacibaculum sp. MAR_2009_124]